MQVLERAGSLARYALFSGKEFSINGYLLCSAMGICALFFSWAFVLYRRPVAKALQHMAGVSIYINVITLAVILIMLFFPSVNLRF
jgi:hypothetical protein